MIKLSPFLIEGYDTSIPPDFKGGLSPAIRAMGAHRMHEAGFDGTGIRVGILDTGIDDTHPDLAGAVAVRRDYVQDGLPPSQFHSHGSNVAGIVGARGALKGLAPGCTLHDYRVLNAQGGGTWQNVTRAVADALADGCDVINLSLGGPDDVPALHEAIRLFVAQAPAIVSVGNEGPGSIGYPGYYPEVIGVGAGVLGEDGRWVRAYFSNTNPEVDVLAPGWDVFSCAAGGGYIRMSGTSQGAPHVTGFAALLLQRAKARLGVSMTEPAIWQALKCATVDVEALGIDAATGAGFVTIFPAFRRPLEVQVTEGANMARVDGTDQELIPGYPQATAETRHGFFNIPMAFVARIQGGSKAWNETTRTGTFWIPRDDA